MFRLNAKRLFYDLGEDSFSSIVVQKDLETILFGNNRKSAMKKILSYVMLASLVVLAASCEDNLAIVDQPDETGLKMVTETVAAKVNDDTKVTYDDNGIAFDPVKAKREKREFENLDRGGMGILIARRNSIDMIYNRINERNVLTMVFDVADADNIC